MESLNGQSFDYVIIGTGLSESILAGALSHDGHSVLHLDSNDYYGSLDASLSLNELDQLAQESVRYEKKRNEETIQQSLSNISNCKINGNLSSELTKASRSYALSLAPSIIPAVGPMIETLISSQVSRYVNFRLVDTVAIYQQGSNKFRRVPFGKADVFQDKSLTLIEKRRLMKFLMWALEYEDDDTIWKENKDKPFSELLQSHFKLSLELTKIIVYALALLPCEKETVSKALPRLRRHIQSVGRYGSSPFLVGQYGGAGEIAQGFCRACAVHGGTYILSSKDMQVTKRQNNDDATDSDTYQISLQENETMSSKKLILGPGYNSDLLPNSDPISSSSTSSKQVIIRGIYLLEKPINLGPEKGGLDILPYLDPETEETDDAKSQQQSNISDTALFVFPPCKEFKYSNSYAFTALQLGSDTFSCPDGQAVLYLTTLHDTNESNDIDPQQILEPFLSALIGPSEISPMWSVSYVDNVLSHELSHENGDSRNGWDIVGWVDQACQIASNKWVDLIQDKDKPMYHGKQGQDEED